MAKHPVIGSLHQQKALKEAGNVYGWSMSDIFCFFRNASRTFYFCFQVISAAVHICLCLLGVSRCEITGACIKITVLPEMPA